MGAAILPALIAPLIGSAVQSVFAPPAPQSVVVAPPQAQPNLSQSAASQIAANTSSQSQAFGQQIMNNILAQAKSQGLTNDQISAIQGKFNTWFNQSQGAINNSLNLAAQQSQAEANYVNQINQNNVNTQVQAQQAAQQGYNSGGFGRLLGGLATNALGGAFGGSSPAPVYSAPAISPFDSIDYSA
jgi:hypothetical protein